MINSSEIVHNNETIYGWLNQVIGERIRELRLREGISQAETARRMHCSKSKVSLCESGKRSITVEYIEDFAQAVHINPAEVFRFPPSVPDDFTYIEEHDGRKMVVIPDAFAKLLSLREGSPIELIPVEEGLLIKPIK